ncbi:hypothetical protein QL285_034288 [Trifolium repens]|nr:hypothetical protein QL285_034288 [Trifolium repens]
MITSANARKDSWQISHVQMYYHRTNHLGEYALFLWAVLSSIWKAHDPRQVLYKGALNPKVRELSRCEEKRRKSSSLLVCRRCLLITGVVTVAELGV